jgi:hypothetical protein
VSTRKGRRQKKKAKYSFLKKRFGEFKIFESLSDGVESKQAEK